MYLNVLFYFGGYCYLKGLFLCFFVILKESVRMSGEATSERQGFHTNGD